MSDLTDTDLEFLEHLMRTYEEDLYGRNMDTGGSGASMYSHRFRIPLKRHASFPGRVQELENLIFTLSNQIQQLATERNVRPNTIQPTLNTDTIDCKHWKELIEAHTKVIRILEVQQAQQGDEFHYSKQIELAERIMRVNILSDQIKENCDQEFETNE